MEKLSRTYEAPGRVCWVKYVKLLFPLAVWCTVLSHQLCDVWHHFPKIFKIVFFPPDIYLSLTCDIDQDVRILESVSLRGVFQTAAVRHFDKFTKERYQAPP